MDYRFKYTNTSGKDKQENKDKIVLTDDNFALIEAINELKNAIARLNLK